MAHAQPSITHGFWRSALPRWSLLFATVALLTFAVLPLSAADPPAHLASVTGTVAVTFANGSSLQPSTVGTSLGPGDRVSTVGKASAAVEIPGVGQVELGADTTIIIDALGLSPGFDAGTMIVAIQIVKGMLVNRLEPNGDRRLAYRVVDPSGGATALATTSATFGVGRDENGNVTVACLSCGRDSLTFPTSGLDLGSGQARTLTARGDVLDRGLHGSVYDALAEGAAAEDGGGKTRAGHRLPPGQRTGSRDDRRTAQEDNGPGQNGTVPASPTPTSLPTPTPGTVISQEATISSFVFLPDPIQIHVGQTVRWTNLDNVSAGHTVTATDHAFTSPVLNQGDTYVRTFTQVGTFEYFCEPHPFMTAFIDVQP
jgi:plastocyanin